MKDAFYIVLIVIATAVLSVFPSEPQVQEAVFPTEPTVCIETIEDVECESIGFEETICETVAVEQTEPEVTEPTEVIPTETEPVFEYTEEELDLLARIIYAEAGSDWIPDEIQLYVGSVVLNRVNHERFPDTIYDVIYQSGQYSPTWTGAINNKPSQRTIDNARYLLEHGSVLPSDVVFQSNGRQGRGVYYEYYDEILKTTTYFCYI